MRKLIMKMSITVDGFVGGPNGEHDWVFKSSDETSKAWSVAQIAGTGLIIMGRKSFEAMAPYWPTASGPFAGPMNEIPKGVFTQNGYKGVDLSNIEPSPARASWEGAQVFSGDLSEEIKKLKSQHGDTICAIGGAGFMRSLINTGLIDEYHLAVHPVCLGAGQTIFNDLDKPLDLKLVEAKDFPGGIVARTYKPA